MADAPRCPETGAIMIRAVRPMSIAYKGLTRTIQMPGWYCDASDESIHSRDDLKVSDRALAELKAEAEGVASPSEVARVRKVLKLTQARASELFGGGPRSFQKYESGEVRTTRTMTLLLRAAERRPAEMLQMAADLGAREPRSQQG